jgi:hypothetical protein
MANKQKIAELSSQLNQVVAHPEFIGLLEELEGLPAESRKQFVRERMNVNALKQKGVPVRPELRAVVRVFENPHAAVINSEAVFTSDSATPRMEEESMDLARAGTLCASLGFILCVSYGESV